jgi:hypothetical protein
MPFRHRLVLICMSALFLSRGAAAGQAPPSASKQNKKATTQTSIDKNAVAIEAVIKQVAEALDHVEAKRKELQIPKFKSVDLTLQTVADKQGGAKIKLWVISFGATHEYKQTQEVVIHLTPPTGKGPSNVGAVNVTEALESTIVSAAQGAQNA